MIVPIELSLVAMRKGYLSPQLTLGWRIGGYIEEFFDGLGQVRLAAGKQGDAALGLTVMCQRRNDALPITVALGARPWDVLAFHYLSGTALKFTAVHRLVDLPKEVRELEYRFEDRNTAIAQAAVRIYRAYLDQLVVRLLNLPVEKYCRIEESRVRIFSIGSNPIAESRVCGLCCRSYPRNELVECDGVVCCVTCSGMEPSWLQWT